jgi:hypothetical protein
MSIGSVGLAVGGILVSLLTFWLGYRQTIGAKQERIRATNAEIESTVLKRMLLEGITPSFRDLVHLISGKAITANLSVGEMRSVDDFVDVLWMRVLENDLIPAERRKEILSTVFPIETDTKAAAGAANLEDGTSLSAQRPRRLVPMVVILVLVAAVLGTAVAAIPAFRTESLSIETVLAFFGVIVAVLALPALVITDAAELRPWNRKAIRALTTYPHAQEAKPALDALVQLSPLAVSRLRRFADDELECLKKGLPKGLGGKNQWNAELLDAGLIERGRRPLRYRAPNGEWLVLTDEGKAVARLLLASGSAPAWLLDAMKRYGASTAVHARGSTNDTPSQASHDDRRHALPPVT